MVKEKDKNKRKSKDQIILELQAHIKSQSELLDLVHQSELNLKRELEVEKKLKQGVISKLQATLKIAESMSHLSEAMQNLYGG